MEAVYIAQGICIFPNHFLEIRDRAGKPKNSKVFGSLLTVNRGNVSFLTQAFEIENSRFYTLSWNLENQLQTESMFSYLKKKPIKNYTKF